MKWLNKMERKFGKYAIHNLTVFLLVGYGVGYILNFTVPSLLYYFMLEPELILKGQIWRLISWIIIPPSDNIIAIIFVMLLYYSLGQTLENSWGAFRYNLYIFSGMLFTVIGAFIAYAMGTGIPVDGVSRVGYYFSTYYINMSIFLTAAAMMPEMQLMLYGIIPVKFKWLAIFDAVWLGIQFVSGPTGQKIAIISALVNFLIFFLANRNMQQYRPKEIARRKKFKREITRPVNNYAGGAKHKCAVCGRTELDAPDLEFRYCSKCKGNYEYCQEHLFTHEHVK